MLLAFSVKGLNDTLGPEGLAPSALVFGEFPYAYTKTEKPESRPNLATRSEIATTARKEMNAHMAKLRIQRALKRRTGTLKDACFQPGYKVLAWREKMVNNRIGEWMGPSIADAVEVEKKMVHVRDDKKCCVIPFNFYQVKKYMEPEMLSRNFMNELIAHTRATNLPGETPEIMTG